MQLRDWLEKVGMKQGDLAVRVGCSTANISYITQGQSVKPALAEKIIRATDGAVGPRDFYPFYKHLEEIQREVRAQAKKGKANGRD